MLKTEEKTIRGHTFRVTQLGFAKSRKTFVRLSKVIGPVLAEFTRSISLRGSDDPPRTIDAIAPDEASPDALPTMGAIDDESAFKSLLDTDISGPLRALAAQLSDDDLDYATRVFGERTEVRPEGHEHFVPLSDVQEILFGGQLDLFFRWLWFCLEVNYGSFFAERGALGAALRTVTASSASRFRRTSTGSSGAS